MKIKLPTIALHEQQADAEVMATSTQQKQELFKSIWAIANELRGSVDGWDFKQYVLGMLFYRYISENITNYIYEEHHRIPTSEEYKALTECHLYPYLDAA